ncbi:MAG: helix-turn-helix domain containing protein, partial [Deinococcales bacterium]
MPEAAAASKEAQILEAAEAVFTEAGYGRARMQQIADRAGVSKASLHYYFRSKDALYRRILGRVTAELMKQLDTALAGTASLE